MEHRPNSRPERTGPFPNTQSRDIGPDEDRDTYSHIRGLEEYFAIRRAIKQWISPLHSNYNLIEESLVSFTNWPRQSPKPKSLSEAGFFFSGKYNSILVLL